MKPKRTGKAFALAVLIAGTTATADASEFKGSLVLLPNGGDATGKTRILGDDFFFDDDNGLVWKADKGDVTDGASIPQELQGLVGHSFDADLIRAAVIHDHYCDDERHNRVRSWRATHRVFYDMLRASDVPLLRAKLLYYAVFTFGPKWGYLDQGDVCGVNCINSVEPRYFEKMTYTYEQAEDGEFNSILATLEAQPAISLDVLDQLAETRHSQDRSFEFRQLPTDSVQPEP